jgi:hypothetical protein
MAARPGNPVSTPVELVLNADERADSGAACSAVAPDAAPARCPDAGATEQELQLRGVLSPADATTFAVEAGRAADA